MISFWLSAIFIGLVVFGLGWLALYLVHKKHDLERSLNFVFLRIMIPKKESKEDQERERDQAAEIRKIIGVGEHFFQSLYGIYSSELHHWWMGQEFFSLEYVAVNDEINFYIGCPRGLQKIIEKQVTSFYPDAVVEETDAPQIFHEGTHQATGYLRTQKKFNYPIKTYMTFESSDPINNILNSLSDASNTAGEAAAVQIMVRPVKNDWQLASRRLAKRLASGKFSIQWWNPISWFSKIFDLLIHGAGDAKTSPSETDKNPESQELVKAIEGKAEKSGFRVLVRCVASAPNDSVARVNLNSILNSFAQYGTPNLNGFKTDTSHKWHSSRALIRNFLFRSFKRSWTPQHKTILNCEELASLFHFPHNKFNKTPAIKWQNYKIAKAPANVPKEGLFLGYNDYRGEHVPVCMKREDRFRHFYVIGQTGTGKSSIFEGMIRQELRQGDGLCVVDPHGSLIDHLLPFVPKSRVDDVIIFDPADLERPMGLNLLEAETDEERDMVALDAMNIMIKMFDEEVFGPRIQDYFRNGCLTLMADPVGGCLTDIVRLFTDDAFQQSKMKYVTNPVVRSFWVKQMAQTGAREKQEMIPYFAAKFGAFVTNAMMRNIIGQPKSAFDFSKVMDQGKILFMNLSKGMTGEINSKMLGLIIVSKIQTAALRRQKNLNSGEKPRDFFLYIDEFQNYVTDSIESILSEARKYRLSLNIAHQYLGQIDTTKQNKKGVNLKEAVFGNIGTIMCYKIGSQDAEYMAKEMAPVFSDQDLINIDAFKAAIKLSVDGQPSRPFSINIPKPWLEKGNDELAVALKQISRLTYGRPRKFVEKEIFTRLDV